MTTFKDKENQFLKETNSERLPSLCGDVIIQFNGYTMITPLCDLLHDFNEYAPMDNVFQVTLYDDRDVLQCKTNFYKAMVEYWWDLWGEEV